MGKKYLLDSNAVIDTLSANYPEEGLAFIKEVIDEEINVSAITKMEVLGYEGDDSAYDKKRELFISNSNVLPINDVVIDKAIELRKRHIKSLPDAVIAATALVHHLTPITRNTKDFSNIKHLRIIDP